MTWNLTVVELGVGEPLLLDVDHLAAHVAGEEPDDTFCLSVKSPKKAAEGLSGHVGQHHDDAGGVAVIYADGHPARVGVGLELVNAERHGQVLQLTKALSTTLFTRCLLGP